MRDSNKSTGHRESDISYLIITYRDRLLQFKTAKSANIQNVALLALFLWDRQRKRPEIT
jgi:hypothetical protein